MASTRLLILLILTAFFSFVIRFGDVVTQVKTMDQAFKATAIAASKSEGDDKDGKEGKEAHVPVPEGLPETEPAPLPKRNWADPTTADLQFSETQRGVLEELKRRRTDLEKREREMDQRQALLDVTEQRIEEKISEMDQMRHELKELLGQQSEQEAGRIKSLVKIYESMKPKDAAAIFDNLDMDILLQVVGQMSERRVSPILASMDTQRAQELTTLLAEQKQLPQLPQ